MSTLPFRRQSSAGPPSSKPYFELSRSYVSSLRPKNAKAESMRFGIIAENPMERIGLASGMVPTPMLEPYGAGFGRTLMVATKLGVFEALVDGP